MASNTPKRAELLAEFYKLHKEQLESLADSTFVGWTGEHEPRQRERSDRIALLLLELNVLDGTPE